MNKVAGRKAARGKTAKGDGTGGSTIPIRVAAVRCAFEGYCSSGSAKASAARLACVQRRLGAGQVLCRGGDRLELLYPVHQGAFRASILSEEGREHITGFYLHGDVMGFDAIASGQHEATVTALEDSVVCALAYHEVESQCHEDLGLHRLLHRLMGREMRAAQDVMVLLGSMDADVRLAAYLLKLSSRINALSSTNAGARPIAGEPPCSEARTLQLQMSRQELADFLGMRHETLSRALRRLRSQGLVAANGRTLSITDGDGLQKLVSAAGAATMARPESPRAPRPGKQAKSPPRRRAPMMQASTRKSSRSA